MKNYREFMRSLVLLLLFVIAALGSSITGDDEDEGVDIERHTLPDGRVELTETRITAHGSFVTSQRGIVNNKGGFEGVVENYVGERLFSKTEYVAGHKNGLEVLYDQNGKRERCYWVLSGWWFFGEVLEQRDPVPCPESSSLNLYSSINPKKMLPVEYANYYEAFESRGAWLIHALNWDGFTSEQIQAFLDALEVEITAAKPTRDSFSSVYSEAISSVTESEEFDLLNKAYRSHQQHYLVEVMMGWPLRLAVLDRYRDGQASTFEVLENSYSYYLIRMQSYGATITDLESVVNELDVRLDQMNQVEPLDVNDTLFPFQIDDRINSAVSEMQEEEFDFGTAFAGIVVDVLLINSWADPLHTAVHDATFGEPGSPLVSANPGGGGQVRFTDIDLACDKPLCLRFYATGDTVSLTAQPNAGYQFLGWEGHCTEAAFACTFEATTLHPVLAHFIAISAIRYPLQVTKAGSGDGTVVSTSPAGIDCGTDCGEDFNENQVVTLKATPAAGNSFAGWSGGCSGTSTCQVTMNTAKTVTATFNLAPPFNDVPAASWAHAYIYAIRDAGITTGCGNNNYCPNDSVTRDQMAVFLVRAIEGDPQSDLCASGSPFSDVPPGAWFCAHVKRLVALAITAGCSADQYCPGNLVNREQMAAFIVRAVAGEPPTDYCGGVGPFNDVAPQAWSCGYIKKLVELGITQGCGNGNYCPSASVTREQMAAFLARAFLAMN